MTNCKLINPNPGFSGTIRLGKFPEVTSMCEPIHTNIPDWINDYQPDDANEKKLIYHFRQLFLHDIESTKYQQALSKIYEILVVKKFLILPDSLRKDYGKAIEQNLKWLTKPLIIITPCLMNLLEDYCQNHPQNENNTIIVRLNQHLNNLRTQPVNSTKYREIHNYLTHNIRRLIKTLEKNHDPFLVKLQPLIKYWRRIQFFDPHVLPKAVRPEAGFYLQQGLSLWIKTNLRWRISDLYNPERQPIEPEIEKKPIDEPKTPATPKPSINDLSREDFYNPASQERVITFLLFNYLKNDPDGYLASRHVKGYPECTYKILAEYFINDGENEKLNQGKLAFPHGKKQEIAERFAIPYQKLASHDISRHFLPFVAALPLRLGLNDKLIKTAIEEDSKETLKKCKKIIKKNEIYNARSLAIELLPMFHTFDQIVNAVTNYLEKKGYNIIIPVEVMNITDPPSLIFTKISQEVTRQTRKLIDIYAIQSYWEKSVIQIINEKIYKKYAIEVSNQETAQFWEIKCLPLLAKLARELHNNSED